MPCQTAMNLMEPLKANVVFKVSTCNIEALQHNFKREHVAEACVPTFGKRLIWQSFLGQLH
jgi:hypothetical protein